MKWRPVGNQGREVWLAVGDVPADRTGDSPGLPGTESLLQARVEELLERAARAEGEVAGLHATVAELRAALTKSETRADRLEAALAEARRPWLAKVLDGLRRR
jgi:uncharacterized coiled-coil protein SlyX